MLLSGAPMTTVARRTSSDLGDTPSSIGQNRVVVGNGTGNALAFDLNRDFHIGN